MTWVTLSFIFCLNSMALSACKDSNGCWVPLMTPTGKHLSSSHGGRANPFLERRRVNKCLPPLVANYRLEAPGEGSSGQHMPVIKAKAQFMLLHRISAVTRHSLCGALHSPTKPYVFPLRRTSQNADTDSKDCDWSTRPVLSVDVLMQPTMGT